MSSEYVKAFIALCSATLLIGLLYFASTSNHVTQSKRGSQPMPIPKSLIQQIRSVSQPTTPLLAAPVTASSPTGVYFIASDKYLSQVITFLNSFRHFNPTIPLALIPYDTLETSAQIIDLAYQYDFSVHYNATLLDELDDFYHEMVPAKPKAGKFRKLAIWSGPFEEFIFMDVDTVVLASFDDVFPLLKYTDVATGQTTPTKYVWKDDEKLLKSGVFTDEQLQYHVNTGMMLSSKRFATTEDMLDKLRANVGFFRAHASDFVVDQPPLNFLFITSSKRYSHLAQLSRQEIPETVKIGFHGSQEIEPLGLKVTGDGKLKCTRKCKQSGRALRNGVLFVHWSGKKCDQGNTAETCSLWEYWSNTTWHHVDPTG